MDEMCAFCEFFGHFNHIIVHSGRKGPCTECKAVMRVIYSIEEPFDILCTCHDARKAENLERRIVRMDAHVDAILLAYWHYSSKEISHVLSKLIASYAFILLQQSLEDRNRIKISFLDVSVDESLKVYLFVPQKSF